jgi:hypothetical protein
MRGNSGAICGEGAAHPVCDGTILRRHGQEHVFVTFNANSQCDLSHLLLTQHSEDGR